MDAGTTVAFLVVIGARFLVPLFIPRFPLPAILGALVLDGIDQTIFQKLGYDPPGYQGYDKAMDVYYLSIAYLAMLRNWTDLTALTVGRVLFFYRLVGVIAFESTQWRPLLLIFPNTFEYFFIAYEVVRCRWNPTRGSRRYWIVAAVAHAGPLASSTSPHRTPRNASSSKTTVPSGMASSAVASADLMPSR